MGVVLPDDAVSLPPAREWQVGQIILDQGSTKDLSGVPPGELRTLQWEQERVFARRILAAPKGSAERTEAVRRAYDTVPKILAAAEGRTGEPLEMGANARGERLVVKLLSRWRARGASPRFFEIGYGCGVLLNAVRQSGFPICGIEVSAALREQACRLLGPGHRRDLLLGDLIRYDFAGPEHRYHLVFWNDVFEHIPPDEISEYLRTIHRLLIPGGQLVTLTPNWHMRPSDITAGFFPPRTEAAGLHLKEYTLCEVTGLLHQAGFPRVATPLFVTPGRIVLGGDGLAGWKRCLEPCLELLPVGLARLLCRGCGLGYTIATKAHY